MRKFLNFIGICLLICFSFAVSAQGITKFADFMTADYWVKNNPTGNSLILSPVQIVDLNAKIRDASHTVFDIASFPQKINGEYVKVKASDFSVLDDELYLHGKLVSDNYKKILKEQSNINKIDKIVSPDYAIVVRRSSLRNQPTAESLFFYAEDTDFDALQETMLEPCEAVIIMHTSKNGFLHYVQSANYCGWISKYNLAKTDRKTWLQYANPDNFIVVAKEHLSLKLWDEDIFYQMGARIPFFEKNEQGYVIEMPARDKNGKLMTVTETIPFSDAVHEGYLPYTSNNLLKCAMAFNGKQYGWGGLKDSVDYSGLLNCVYRSMGIFLPRNADEQETTYGTHTSFADLTAEQRLQVVKQLTPGTALFMDGHCMIYLGTSADIPYVIHALGSCCVDGKNQKIMEVVVSDLTLQCSNGRSFLDEITQAVEYK